MIYAPLWYYGIGLAWLISGHLIGWLKWRGDPLAVTVWTFVAAAVWPWFLYKILRDLSRGQSETDLT